MILRAAVTSSDGKTVDLHFGQCEAFRIAEIDTETGAWRIAEQRKTERTCHDFSHQELRVKAAAELLSDCRFLLTYRIGMYPYSLLRSRGVTCLETSEVEPVPIGKAVERLCKYIRLEGILSGADAAQENEPAGAQTPFPWETKEETQ